MQKCGAKKRGIGWELSFEQWLEFWGEDIDRRGSGANDLQMLSAAGLGIAFHAKPVVRAAAGHAISTLGLDALL